mgnify:CR=1 FL=1
MNAVLSLVLVVLASCAALATSLESFVVLTRDGPVEGRVHHENPNVLSFPNIPFAKPPGLLNHLAAHKLVLAVGPLRFKAPQPVTAWTDVRPFAPLLPACPQFRSA